MSCAWGRDRTSRRILAGKAWVLAGGSRRSRSRPCSGVRVTGAMTAWLPVSLCDVVEAGLLDPADWTAKPVGAAWDEDPESDDRRPSLVRREFHVADDLVSARLYATAHGLYEAEVNGARVGDDTLSPGWTVYPKRLRYYTYDVTDLVEPGAERDRRLARRRLVPRPARLARWLPQPLRRRPLVPRSARADLRRRHREIGGDGCRVEGGALADPAHRHLRRRGLRRASRADRLVAARVRRRGVGRRRRPRPRPATLVAPTAPPVRCTEEVRPIAVLTSPTGARILDFGQNLVGASASASRAPQAAPCAIRTSEVVQDGEVYTRPLREARSTDHYTLAGRRAARSGSRASPSTASATPRSTAGPVTSTPPRPRVTWSPGSTTPTSSAPAGSTPPIRS